jgi:hypothetical protein
MTSPSDAGRTTPISCTTLRSLALIALALFGATACSSITLPGQDEVPCGESRATSAKGAALEAGGVALASVTVSLYESREGSPSIDLGVFGRSTSVAGPLRGHVMAARIVTRSGTSVFQPAAVQQVAASDAGGALIMYLGTTLHDPALFEGARKLFLTNDLVVELDTDYAGAEHLRIPMTLYLAGDFIPIYCK